MLSSLARANCVAYSRPFLCAQRLNPLKQSVNHFRLLAPLRSDVKYPIQNWGWEYLQKQKELSRPLSPHLTVYRPMLTWMVSGAFRIAGVVMGGVIIVGSLGLLVLPFDYTEAINYVRSWNIPSPITNAFKFIVAWPIVFHALNGLRFIGFNMAKGTDIPTVYKTGYLVLALATVMAIALVAWCGDKPLPPLDYKRKN